MSMPSQWQNFLCALEEYFGAAAVAARHEIYFLNRRPYAALRSLAALARDAILLRRGTRHALTDDAHVYLVATLAGPSGWQTLERAQQALPKGMTSCVITHPRVHLHDVKKHTLTRPSWGDIARALARGWPFGRRRHGGISGVVVYTCMVRHYLWQAVWRRTFPTARPVFILHNDFDMMSHALIAAFGDMAPIACIQHGIPTDEFFPTNAPMQVLWGHSSKETYSRAGHRGKAIVDALSRGKRTPPKADAPTRILVLSQTHTPIYGIDLLPLFGELAHTLAAHAEHYLDILLHPMESHIAAYPPALHPLLKHPPHPMLAATHSPQMVIGYSSTAMLDAAAAGHYVIGMQWPVTASTHTHALAQPPMRCANADEAIAYFETLRNDASARIRHHHAQEQWLQHTYHSSGDFSSWVASCIA